MISTIYSKLIFVPAFCWITIISSAKTNSENTDSIPWQKLSYEAYDLYFTKPDTGVVKNIEAYLRSGFKYVSGFFHHPFQKKIDVYIFPQRSLLDNQWQKDWGDTSFQSQCWMIASGIAYRLDLLSPNAWTKEACDHNANDSVEIRKVIWHELTHVYQGQFNPDHTFSYIEKMDWFVEGLATYASGQLTEDRLKRIRQLIQQDKIPTSLDDFWKGSEKYGLSGSVVAYIDKEYGREKLFELLKFTNKNDALSFLKIKEEDLLKKWKDSL